MDSKELLQHLVEVAEGLYLTPYLCPAGVPTIGLGSTHYENGRRVTLADPPITKERAYELFRWYVRTNIDPTISKAVKVPLTGGQYAAIGDFIYNLGPTAFLSSTMLKRINAGRWDDVPAQMRRWVIQGSKPLKGLILRRERAIKCLSLP